MLSVIATKTDLYAFAKKYFNLLPDEVDAFIRSNSNKTKDIYRRLDSVLTALEKYLDSYSSVVSIDHKKKVGRVIFQKLNFKSFNEDCERSYQRINSLFHDMTARGINPYEMLYSAVLTNGEVFLDEDGNFSKLKEENEQFNSVFPTIAKTLGVEDKKVISMYERCSSLIYKADKTKVKKNYELLKNFKTKQGQLFNNIEVVDIFINNPSLFTLSPKSVELAYNHIVNRASIYIYDHYEKTGEKLSLKETLRNWISKNSSLLSINVAEIKRKENALTNCFKSYYKEEEADEIIFNLFYNPTNLACVNKISKENFFGVSFNYWNVVGLIHDYLGEELSFEALKKARQIYGVNAQKLKSLFIDLHKAGVEKEKVAGKLDAIVLYFDKFSNAEIVGKIKNNNILLPIKLYNMTKREIAQKFYEVFAGKNNEEMFDKFLTLLHLNYRHEELAEYSDEVTKEIDELIDLFGLREKRDLHEILKNRDNRVKIATKSEVLMGKIYTYIGNMCALYNNESGEEIDEITKKFESDVKNLYESIETSFQKGIAKAKTIYRNPEELYETFKENSVHKIDLNNLPRKRLDGIVKKFDDELLKPLSTALTENQFLQGNSYQMSIFDLQDVEDKTVNLPCSSTDSEISKFMEKRKKDFKQMARIMNCYSKAEEIRIL